jgi:hypothetical protein
MGQGVLHIGLYAFRAFGHPGFSRLGQSLRIALWASWNVVYRERYTKWWAKLVGNFKKKGLD